ncbi:YifB family Mg chelatase-like AAA ATPase [Rhodococcoides corynebacterioides]|uniref:YifB family Mg chelatase-like AAA ATPase n=1 Tax=Rhodococcoides corynebacterioides TaxID=53972 RepID=A0ABS7P4K0_9NOCA|nr:YifB family Mg chelatase-like AAA ATPase [Rhodococcus corynebacterioides]MBY6367351.1 YifB family Mg chelatase-like AAA ATPase [Rhodococcus corynebacterioides]MBY6409631.1 YifB family Mg chelatase-like AAA ATPase [Rhodococcus corynebacterioides]
MALGRAFSVAVTGIDGVLVEIEADVGRGLPGVHVVGLPDTALQESRDRVRAAVTNSGQDWPVSKVVLALSPATLPKVGSVYDLAMACAVLGAARVVPADPLLTTVLLGELALDGRVRTVRGILPAVLAARRAERTRVIVPTGSLAEAGLVSGIEVRGASHLREVVDWMRGRGDLAVPESATEVGADRYEDLADVAGQADARWAVEVAAAGAHHLMLTGPPGIGKTMLAGRLPGLLPPLTEEQALEVTAVHSVAGTLTPERPLITAAPFVAPHHTSTVASLVGGGSGVARPGAVSRAHHGVLFLDECAEMSVRVLEALRTPLEDGEVRIARRDGVARYPARFQLVLAANPCPCAAPRAAACVCAPAARRRYLGKLSGPLLDRVDLRLAMHGDAGGLLADGPGESSADVRDRVAAARAAARERWREHGWHTNAEVPGAALRQRFRLSRDALTPIERALRRGAITARGADRILRVAWTLADLQGAPVPQVDCVLAAMSFREQSPADTTGART